MNLWRILPVMGFVDNDLLKSKKSSDFGLHIGLSHPSFESRWRPWRVRVKKQHGIKQSNILCFLAISKDVINESPLARSCLMSMPSLTWMYIYDFMYHINVEHQGSRKRGAEGGFILPPSTIDLGIRKENRRRNGNLLLLLPSP